MIVHEYLPNGTVEDFLRTPKGRALSLHRRLLMAKVPNPARYA